MKNRMGAACNTYGEMNGAYTVRLDILRKRDHLENIDVDIILRWIFQKWDKDRTDLA
jgi:hypothetical protein